jgi:hypothetical protein
MQIENLKIWQWMIAGVLVGLLFSVVQNFQGPWFDNAPLETIESGQLDWLAMYDQRPPPNGWKGERERKEKAYVTFYHAGQPMIKDVVVHPAPPTDKSGQWWVTGKYFKVDEEKDPKDASKTIATATWVPFKSPATAPYLPMYHSAHIVAVQAELTQLLKDQQEAKDAGKEFQSDKLKGIRDRQNEIASDARLQKTLGGPDSFANVADFLKFAQAAEPERKLKFSVAFWEKKPFMWTLPAVAGIFVIGLGGPLLVQILQAMGLAAVPAPSLSAAPKPKPTPKAAPAKRPVPVMAMGNVTVVAPAPPKPMTEAEKKQYGGEFYPVVKTTAHKDTH